MPTLEAPSGEQAPPAAGTMPHDDKEAVKWLQHSYQQIRDELGKVIVGQDEVLEQLLIGIFARGHCLLEGVPGLAKTLLISTVARCLELSFRRIQFTPDLMPSDILGTEVLQEDPTTRQRQFKFMRGPIFANLVLADEINRTPPKTQAALLEAMQERCVSLGNEVYKLDQPFFVLATQNPIEQEGTYPLPEAQLDRFLFKIFVSYPGDAEEMEIVRRVASPVMREREKSLAHIMSGATVMQVQDLVLRVPVAEQILTYAKNIARATRPKQPEAPEFIRQWVSWGAGPRATINLILAAKARAVLHGKFAVTWEDVAAVAPPVLRHRISCNYTASAEDITTDKVIEKLLGTIAKG